MKAVSLLPVDAPMTLPRVFAMQRCEEAEVDSLFKIMELEDEERERLLDMPMSKVSPALFRRTGEEVVLRTVVS